MTGHLFDSAQRARKRLRVGSLTMHIWKMKKTKKKDTQTTYYLNPNITLSIRQNIKLPSDRLAAAHTVYMSMSMKKQTPMTWDNPLWCVCTNLLHVQ